ncbi:MAG: trypsin-like peptidase domain-containing protein [Alphaproteobacteria bacterium]|nr:trypsin-like peptidase domain-containing protein [Alphaproteobacteria bacterium]
MFVFWFSPALASSAAMLKECTDTVADTQDLVRRTVRIQTSLGSGSGVLVSPDGFILTAAHVVGGAANVDVIMFDGAHTSGQVLRTKGAADLALVKVDAHQLPCVALGAARPSVGADVRIVASPGGETLSHSVTKGVVSAFRDVDGWTILQTDASVNAGSSGGMVVDEGGHLTGIVSFKAVGVGVEGLGFAVAAENVERALDIEFGAETATVIAEKRDDDVPGSSKGVVVQVTNRPEQPDQPLEGPKICANVDIKKDAFSEGTQLKGNGANEFQLAWTSGGDPLLTVFLPASVFGLSPAAVVPGALTLDMLLTDGTRIHTVSNGTGGWDSYGMLSVYFPISVEAIGAIGSAGPELQRWTLAGSSVDQQRSQRQRDKYYQPVFSCFYREMTATR